jgi:uncharacterized protein
MHRIGLISDTHGLLRPEAVAFLQGCERIVHGGDICDASVIEALVRIAPVTAVRGNNDRGSWADAIPESLQVRVDDVTIYAIHDLSQMSIVPAVEGIRVVVSGHSHKPAIAERDGVLYVNPGSAGPRRFSLPISIGELVIDGESVEARLVTLDVAPRGS